jgi:hypothetical protein
MTSIVSEFDPDRWPRRGQRNREPAQRHAAIPLPAGYSARVDDINRIEWAALLSSFDDANIYQTWEYEAAQSSESALSHLVLLHHGQPVAAAQCRVRRLAFLKIGVAYVRWGPMWRRNQLPPSPETLALALRALRNEYACRRGLCVRVLPRLFGADGIVSTSLFNAERYHLQAFEGAQRTLVLPLEAALPAIRSAVDQKWRNRLNRAERSHLQIVEGCDESVFATFAQIHAQMQSRKAFASTSNLQTFRLAQKSLPRALKLKVAIAMDAGVPVAGVVYSDIGDTGVFLFGATADAGMKANGSYLLQWLVVQRLHSNGARYYNLHGINPALNPGTYHFKSGLCGRLGHDVHYIGTFDTSTSGFSQGAVHLARRLQYASRRILGMFSRITCRSRSPQV